MTPVMRPTSGIRLRSKQAQWYTPLHNALERMAREKLHSVYDKCFKAKDIRFSWADIRDAGMYEDKKGTYIEATFHCSIYFNKAFIGIETPVELYALPNAVAFGGSDDTLRFVYTLKLYI